MRDRPPDVLSAVLTMDDKTCSPSQSEKKKLRRRGVPESPHEANDAVDESSSSGCPSDQGDASDEGELDWAEKKVELERIYNSLKSNPNVSSSQCVTYIKIAERALFKIPIRDCWFLVTWILLTISSFLPNELSCFRLRWMRMFIDIYSFGDSETQPLLKGAQNYLMTHVPLLEVFPYLMGYLYDESVNRCEILRCIGDYFFLGKSTTLPVQNIEELFNSMICFLTDEDSDVRDLAVLILGRMHYTWEAVTPFLEEIQLDPTTYSKIFKERENLDMMFKIKEAQELEKEQREHFSPDVGGSVVTTAEASTSRQQTPVQELTARQTNIVDLAPEHITPLLSETWAQAYSALQHLMVRLNSADEVSGDVTSTVTSLLLMIEAEDTNSLCVKAAIKCVALLARIMKSDFAPYVKAVVRLFKEKDNEPALTALIREAMHDIRFNMEACGIMI